jgi:hypothetical protein
MDEAQLAMIHAAGVRRSDDPEMAARRDGVALMMAESLARVEALENALRQAEARQTQADEKISVYFDRKMNAIDIMGWSLAAVPVELGARWAMGRFGRKTLDKMPNWLGRRMRLNPNRAWSKKGVSERGLENFFTGWGPLVNMLGVEQSYVLHGVTGTALIAHELADEQLFQSQVEMQLTGLEIQLLRTDIAAIRSRLSFLTTVIAAQGGI